MKITTNYAALLLLLFPFGMQAQYTGGPGGGASSERSEDAAVIVSSGGAAPAAGSNIIIDDDLTLPGTGTIAYNSITVRPGKRFTVPLGRTIEMPTNGRVRLRANGNGYSQLRIVGGLTFGTGATLVQEQMIPAEGWVNLGVPLNASSTVSVFGTINQNAPGANANTKNLKFWDASTSQWTDVTPATDITPGRGYNGFVGGPLGIQSSSGKISVEGIPNTSVTLPVDYHNPGTTVGFTGPADGWNFLANPFAAALNFAALSLTNVEDAYYIWNPATESYESWAAAGGSGSTLTQFIPPLQGFWVRATAASPSIGTLNYADHTVDNQAPNFRKTDEIMGHMRFQVVHSGDSTALDALTLAFINGTTSGFDNGWDARKMHNPSPSINFYTNGQNDALSINAIPFDPNTLSTYVLPIGLNQVKVGGQFEIQLATNENTGNVAVYLEDLALKKFHQLNDGAYSFTSQPRQEDRFKLHLTTNPSWTATETSENFTAWVHQSELFIAPAIYSGPAHFCIYDLSGRLLHTNKDILLADNTIQIFSLDFLQSGIYVIEIGAGQTTQIIKALR
jgi:hypothetical protein